MPSDAEIDALIERLNVLCNPLSEMLPERERLTAFVRDGDEAARFLAALRDERDGLERGLRTVQNAAKTIASAQGTELEHLRQNRTYDYKLRQEHESLLERDAQMTDALLAAEARVRELEQKLERAREALRVGLDLISEEKGWGTYPRMEGSEIYAEADVFRELARATLAEIGQRE